MARSCHRTQFGWCELVGGGETWHTLQHDDDDHEGGDDNLDFDNDALQHDDAIEDGAFGYCDNTDVDGSTWKGVGWLESACLCKYTKLGKRAFNCKRRFIHNMLMVVEVVVCLWEGPLAWNKGVSARNNTGAGSCLQKICWKAKSVTNCFREPPWWEIWQLVKLAPLLWNSILGVELPGITQLKGRVYYFTKEFLSVFQPSWYIHCSVGSCCLYKLLYTSRPPRDPFISSHPNPRYYIRPELKML